MVRVRLKFRHQLDNDAVLIRRRVNGRNHTISVRTAKRIFDFFSANSKRGGFISIDVYVNLWTGNLQISCYVLQQRILAQMFFELEGLCVEQLGIGTLQSNLEKTLRQLSAKTNRGWIL